MVRFVDSSRAQAKADIRRRMVTPFTATFYGDILTRKGRMKFEFDVIADRGRLGDAELGRQITRVMDMIKQRRIVPNAGLPGRYGVFGSFRSLFQSKWTRHLGVQKYDVDRHYERGTGTGVSAG